MPARTRWKGTAAQLAAALLGGLPAAGMATEDTPEPDRLRIAIDFPVPATRAGEVDGLSLVSGRVLSYQGRLDLYEVVFAIDVSGSTADPSGVDADGDGKARGRGGILSSRKKGAADNILSAELAAVRALVDRLDPRTTRVSIVVFSGDDLQGTPDALIEVPLTSNYRRVRKGLEEIALVPPQGATNMEDGLRTALAQLRSKPRPDAEGEPQRFIVFLTDGEPALSYRTSEEIGEAALGIARQAAKRRVRILSYALGRDAVDRPKYPSEMARLTNGRFVAVRDLKTLSLELAHVSFANLASVTLRNRTLDVGPSCQIVSPDGRFAALLPMRAGANSVEVRARSTLETEESAEVTVDFAPGTSLAAALDEDQREELLRLRSICERERPTRERSLEIEPER